MTLRRNLAALLLGFLAGAVFLSVYSASRLEELYREKERLRVELFESQDRLARLEAILATHREGEIVSVAVELNTSLDKLTELEMRGALSEIAAGLVGQSIEEINPELLLALFHNRKITVDGKDYLITVNWVVVARETKFNLNAVPADG